jgi:hypothetical protein
MPAFVDFPVGEFQNIQHPDARVQDQRILTRFFMAPVYEKYYILCNVGVETNPIRWKMSL